MQPIAASKPKLAQMADSSETTALAVAILCCFLCGNAFLTSSASPDSFLQCLSAMLPSELVYQQSSSGFTSVLESSVQNPKLKSTGWYRRQS